MLITPFEVNTQIKKLYYRLDVLEEEGKWEDVTLTVSRPID